MFLLPKKTEIAGILFVDGISAILFLRRGVFKLLWELFFMKMRISLEPNGEVDICQKTSIMFHVKQFDG